MAEHDHIARLAKLIDSDIRKDKHLLLTESEVVGLRRQGAIDLHSICTDFVVSVNRQLIAASSRTLAARICCRDVFANLA